MADRPKKKQQSGVRNPDRRNGKAPKKHPKLQRTLTDEERAARDEKRAAYERRKAEAERRAAKRQRDFINRKHAEALALHKVWLADQQRARAAEALRSMPRPSVEV